MEIGNSLASMMRSPASLNTVPMVRVCSEMNCNAIIGQPSIGNMCELCVARMTSRPSFSNTKNGSREEIGDYSITSAAQRSIYPSITMEAAKKERPTSVLSHMGRPSSQCHPNMTTFSDIQHRRPSVAVPYAVNRTLRVPSSMMSRTPIVNHFNSRGEVIQDVYKQLEHKVSAQRGRQQTQINHRVCLRCLRSVPFHYIDDLCPNCRAEVATQPATRSQSITPVHESAPPFQNNYTLHAKATVGLTLTREALSIIAGVDNNGRDDESDIDMEGLELSYPLQSFDGAAVPPPEPPKDGLILKADFSVPSTATKRQKLSHPNVIDLTDSPMSGSLVLPNTTPLDDPASCITVSEKGKAKAFVPSSKPAKTPTQSLKLCSTTDCTGIISIDSSATRCLACVRREWKWKRLGIPANHNNTSDIGRNSSGILKPFKPPTKRIKKKGVTWADEILPTAISETKSRYLAAESFIVVPDTVLSTDPINNEKVSLPEGESVEDTLVLEDYLNLDALQETDSDIQERQANDVEGALNPSSNFLNDNSQTPLGLVHVDHGEHYQRPSLRANAISPPLEVMFPNEAPNDGPGTSEGSLSKIPGHISGWDSDLSDLSSSSEQEDSDSTSSLESDSETSPSTPTPMPSGLKIRIPARPPGIYSMKCASRKCDQPLPMSYQWKSCVMCRARRRHYQHKRQNLQRRHERLDEELMQVQDLGTPLPVELLSNETTKVEEDVTLVPGARLCAIRNCTYIIPPASEYRWKMCALCRLCKREKREQEKLENPHFSVGPLCQSPSKKRVVDSTFILQSLDCLRRKTSAPGSGRCRSLDCGMLVVDSSLPDCRQCAARRLWVMNRSDSGLNGPETSTKSIERHRGPAPYPQYKCFSAFLLEFKDRLAGFLQSQSIFFLFKEPKVGNALFAFDGEYSVVALNFDVVRRKEEIDANVLKLKREIEYVGRIKFSHKRSVSILDGGGIAIRFSCIQPTPVLQPSKHDGQASLATLAKPMQCEMEIAVLPDHSHRFIPGQRTIIRFRLFG